MKDFTKISLKGIFKIYKIKNNKKELIYEDKNVVLVQSAEFIRNLAFGETDNLITQILIGDQNLTYETLDNLVQPSNTDTGLIHIIFQKDYTSQEKTIYTDENNNTYPAITYTFDINEDEANSIDNDYNIWAEYGLADSSGNVWAKKAKILFKDSGTKYTIEWQIVFII